MRIPMLALGARPVLAGVYKGREIFAKLIERTGKEPTNPEPVFLDFTGVEVASASFLRESVLAFRDTVRSRHSNFYPVVANANDTVCDELAVLVAPRGDVLVLCSLNEDGQTHEVRFAGELDPKQRITYDLVQEHGETDAAALKREGENDDRVSQTAWNNRLSALANLGLVVELSQGRAKRYRPLFMEADYGN